MREENQILNDFSNYLIIKNYSEGTIREYNSDLLIFFNFLIKYLGLEINISDINIFILATVKESDIFAFLIYLNHSKENSSKTRNRKLSAIKTFFKYLYNKYPYFKDKLDPARNVERAEIVFRLPKYLKLKDAKNLQHIFNASNSRNSIRNNTIITLFLNTGMRLSELVNINIKNIDFNTKTINIIGKGNKERIVYLNKSALNAIKKYLNTRNYYEDEPLFIDNGNKRITTYNVEKICKQAFKLAGLEEYGFSVHSLRHTTAAYIYKETKDILVVKQLLGHENLNTTEIYTHIDNNEVRNAVNSNPLNNFNKIEKRGEKFI